VLVLAAGLEQAGQVGLALAAADVVREQVGHGGHDPDDRQYLERPAPVGRAEHPAEQGTGERAHALRQPEQAHHQTAPLRRDQVADHREADRPDRAEPERGDHLHGEEGGVSVHQRAATGTDRPQQRAGHQEHLAVGPVPRVCPADRDDRGDQVAQRRGQRDGPLRYPEAAAYRRVERRYQADRHVVEGGQDDEDDDGVDPVHARHAGTQPQLSGSRNPGRCLIMGG
jgi:hypothetical protein